MNNQKKQFKNIYSKMASFEAVENKKERLEQGLHTSTAPLGYKWERIGSRRRGYSVLAVDKYTSVIVKDIFRAYATGAYNYEAMKEYINKRWDMRKSKFSTQTLLCNPFYRGILKTKFGQAPHAYERIIDDALFDKVQEVMKNRQVTYARAKQNTKKKEYLYSGLLKCGSCGCQITVEKHKGIIYYHCTQSKGKHKAPWINQADLTVRMRDAIIPYLEEAQTENWAIPVYPEILKDQEQTRQLLCFLFKKITLNQDKTLTLSQWSAQELASLHKRKEKPVEQVPVDPNGDMNTNILMLCYLPQDINFLSLTLEKDLETIQSALIDLQLSGKIDQTLEGLWITL